MKWSVIGLLVLGVGAAVSATVLVVSLRAGASLRGAPGVPGGMQAAPISEVGIVVAVASLPAMTVVDARSVVEKAVRKEEAPAGYFSDPVQVAGQVLAVPMVEGQVFTSACFVTKGSGRDLAAALPEGMRAVSVALSDYSGLEGILYPGCVVDVLVSMKPPAARGGPSESFARTLLERIGVLAIGDLTVVAPEEGSKSRVRDRTGRQIITLMVDVRHAEMLRLALEHGTVSLAMRSPLDAAPLESRGVLLSELSPEYFDRPAPSEEAVSVAVAANKKSVDEPQTEPKSHSPVVWEVVILRGASTEKRLVPTNGPSSDG